MESSFVQIIGSMLLLCGRGSAPCKPFFTKLVIHSALGSFTGAEDQAARREAIWAVSNCT